MSQSQQLEQIRAQLTGWFLTQLPDVDQLELSELVMPGAGSSNETFFLTLNTVTAGHALCRELVIRWQPKGFLVFPQDAYDMAQQYTLQHRLAATDVPVPEVLWCETDASVIGAPFYIMQRVNGWIPGDFPPYHQAGELAELDDRDKATVWYGVVETMAKVHRVDWQALQLDFLAQPNDGEFMPAQIAAWDRVAALNSEPLAPMLRQTRQWLLDNRFKPRHLSLCWGDARLGNTIYQDKSVVAALDWELACIGDPESDLAWFAHTDWASSAGRSSGAIERLAGLPSIEQTVAYYESLMARKVENFLYYDVFATYRLALVYTRVEQDQRYLQRTGGKKGLLTANHFAKLDQLIN